MKACNKEWSRIIIRNWQHKKVRHRTIRPSRATPCDLNQCISRMVKTGICVHNYQVYFKTNLMTRFQKRPPIPIVVCTQPTQAMSPGKQDQWSVDLCDCFSDCSDCLCAFFCTPCYMYSIFSRANEGCCSCCFVPLGQLRTKVRVERGIHVFYKFHSLPNVLVFLLIN